MVSQIVILNIGIRHGADLKMQVPVLIHAHIGNIPVLENASLLVGLRDQEVRKVKGDHCQDNCGDEIGTEHAIIAHPAAEDGHDLCIGGQLCSEIDHRDEREEVAEQVYEIWDEVDVVIKNDPFQRGPLFEELIDVFGNVEDDHDEDQQEDGEKKGAQELLDDIQVNFLHRMRNGFIIPKV
jgi:hypothetical protein